MLHLICILVYLTAMVWLAKVLRLCGVVFLALKWHRPQYWCCKTSVRLICKNVIIMEALGELE